MFRLKVVNQQGEEIISEEGKEEQKPATRQDRERLYIRS